MTYHVLPLAWLPQSSPSSDMTFLTLSEIWKLNGLGIGPINDGPSIEPILNYTYILVSGFLFCRC